MKLNLRNHRFGLGPSVYRSSNSAGGGGEPSYTVALIYDDSFTIDRASPLPSNTAFAASGIGNTKVFNRTNSAITGGKLEFNGDVNLMIMDATDPGRARLSGRIHYCNHDIGTTTDFQSFAPIALSGENPAANWWALERGSPGIRFKAGGSVGDIRTMLRTPQPPDGTYAIKAAVTQNKLYEWALIERSTGSFSLYRVDSGDWRMIAAEKLSTLAGKAWCANDSSGVTSLNRLCTANTDYLPASIVQNSFATVTTPSDGLGQPETVGSGKTGESTGDVVISASALQMNSDGQGYVVYDTGQTEVYCSSDMTVYDGSECGVIVRYVDASNYIAALVNSTANTIRIVEVVAGVQTTLISQDTNLTPDFYTIADAQAMEINVTINGNEISAVFRPGPLHLGFVNTTTTRFASATKAGVIINKGAGVNSAKATNFAAWAVVQNGLPEMVNT